jgi:hypothetical protein
MLVIATATDAPTQPAQRVRLLIYDETNPASPLAKAKTKKIHASLPKEGPFVQTSSAQMKTNAQRMRRLAFFVVLGLGTVVPVSAFAQNTKETLETPQMREAKDRYDRGLKLFADKDYEAARIEFEKAYELVPSFKILYNIGVCDANRNDYVGAIENLQKYLSQGGAEVAPERRTEVETLVKDIRPRIGHIAVKSNVDGAVVAIDDVQIGTTPLARPVDVNPGTRKVTVSKTGYIPQTQAVTVAGSETDNVALTIQPTATVTIKKGVSPWPFVLWGTTAALAVGAGVTGYLALKNSDDLNTLNNQTPPAGVDAATYAKQLESKRGDMRTFSIVADSLTAGAIVVGAVALVVTVVTFSKHKETGESVSLVVRPGGLGLAGTF